MNTLAADYIGMNSGLKTLAFNLNRMQEEIRSLASGCRHLDIFWDGDANSEFVRIIDEDIVYMQTVLFSIRTLIEALDTIIDEYQENEKVINRMIGGMKI